jgi:hypothetical protein
MVLAGMHSWALLGSHTDEGWIATICTVYSGVASQHPNCGAVPAMLGSQRLIDQAQASML